MISRHTVQPTALQHVEASVPSGRGRNVSRASRRGDETRPHPNGGSRSPALHPALPSTPKSFKKKLKDPTFAKGVDREEVERGASLIDVELSQHIENVITAMRGIAAELGITGAQLQSGGREAVQAET